jgi:hypothetical protein
VRKVLAALVLSAIAFLLTMTLVAELWVAIFPPQSHYNIMRLVK